MSINRLDHLIDWYDTELDDVVVLDLTIVSHPSGDLYLEDFLAMRSTWGDAPQADLLESIGVIGWMDRGAGNDDPYVYLLRFDADDDLYQVALTKLPMTPITI